MRLPGRGALTARGQGEEAAAGQQDDQRVHARLGGVVDREGRAGQQDEHRPGHGPAAESPPAEPADRERGHGDEARERPDGIVGLPEQGDPEVQQVVVERRGPVVLQGVGDLVQRQAGDVDGQRLVEPQARSGPEAEEQSGGDDEPHRHAGNEARTTGESGNLLRHGAHGRTMGLGLGSSAAGGGRARSEGNRRTKGGKGGCDPLHHQAGGAAHHHHPLRLRRDLLPGPPSPGQPHDHDPRAELHRAERGHAQPPARPGQAAVAAVLHLDRPRVPGQPGSVVHDAPVDGDHHQAVVPDRPRADHLLPDHRLRHRLPDGDASRPAGPTSCSTRRRTARRSPCWRSRRSSSRRCWC